MAPLLRPEFRNQITRPLTVTSVRKTEFFIPISSDKKVTTSGFRVLAYHLASFFFLHPPLSCYSFGLLYWPLCPLLYPPGLHSDLNSLLPSTGRPRSWPIFLIPLLTVNLWGLLIQTRRSRGNWSYRSPLRGRPRDTLDQQFLHRHTDTHARTQTQTQIYIYIYIYIFIYISDR